MKPVALIIASLLSACAWPDRWNAGYAHEPASGPLAARDIYSVGVSGPLGLHPKPPVVIREGEAP